MALPGSPVATPTQANKNLYNGGSEWQNDFGDLPDLQQTFYRNYDAALGRWTGVDPMADASESLSVYQYASNNPVMNNDPLGNLAQYTEPGKARIRDGQRDFEEWLNSMSSWNEDGTYRFNPGGSSGGGGISRGFSLFNADGGGKFDSAKEALDFAQNIVFENGQAGTYQIVGREYYFGDHSSLIVNNYDYGNGKWVWNFTALQSNGPSFSSATENFSNGVNGYTAAQNALGDINTGITGFGGGGGLQNELLDFAVRANYKSARTLSEFKALRATQRSWRMTNTLGKTGSQFLKGTKLLGYGIGVASMAITATRAGLYYANGGHGAEVAIKAGIDFVMTGIGFLGPIGFAVSTTYFVIDVATDGFGGYGKIK